jgi:acyl dehydratase
MKVAWAEIARATGELDLGCSDWRAVTQNQVELFAEATGDRQFIHLDPERAAREGPFGANVAHGYLLLAMIPALLSERLELPAGAAVLNFGLDKLRFAAAVRVGERVRGRFALIGKNRLEPTTTLVKIRASIEVEGAPRPALSIDPLIALVRFASG